MVAAKAKRADIGARPANADPQAHAIASVTGLPEDTIRLAISALIVVLIEVGAIGGGIMATAPKVGAIAPVKETAAALPEPANDNGEPVQPVRLRRGPAAPRLTAGGHFEW